MAHHTHPHIPANTLTAGLIVLALALAPMGALAAEQPAHVRGAIIKTSDHAIDVQTSTGIVHLSLAKAKVAEVVTASRAAIVPAAYVGIATRGEAVNAPAQEVVVFPESARGFAEGHFAWDLASRSSMMTNGTVAPARSAMTNGTVSSGAPPSGPLVITVTYKNGRRQISIPPNTPIVTFHDGSKADLAVGNHVFALAGMSAGKPATAQFIFVGKNGLVPPM